MVKRKIVAVCGQAAIGKQHFIEQLRSRPDLRERFEIPEDFCAFGPKASHVDEIRRAQCDVAIWKAQHFTHYFIYGFAIDYPNVEQRVILIWRPPKLHLPDHRGKGEQRLKDAHRRGDKRHIELFTRTVKMDERKLSEQWRGGFLPWFGPDSKLQKKFKIRPVLLDGSTEQYKEINWGSTLAAPR
jgi:hypothetical protein